MTIRNLPEETHRALKQRVALHHNSTEAEIWIILEQAVRPAHRVRLGSALAAFGQQHGDFELNLARNAAPAEPATFE